jgi:hypothetical protein
MKKVEYQIIVNGNVQETLLPFNNLNDCINLLKAWKKRNAIEKSDVVVIRTTTIIEEEIEVE